MARAKKAEGGSPPAPVQLMLRPTVLITDGTPTYYINHAEISVSPYEFGIATARLPTKPTAEQIAAARITGELAVEAELVLLMPASVIPGLIRALTQQKTLYETQYGPIFDAGGINDPT